MEREWLNRKTSSFLHFLGTVLPAFCDQLEVLCFVISATFLLSIPAIMLIIKTLLCNTNLAVWHTMGKKRKKGKKKKKYNDFSDQTSLRLHILRLVIFHLFKKCYHTRITLQHLFRLAPHERI